MPKALNPNMMIFTIFTFTFVSVLSISQSLKHERISEIICLLSRSKNADLLNAASTNSNKLIKSLFQQCNIKVRVMSDVEDVKNDIISFTNPQKKNKETF